MINPNKPWYSFNNLVFYLMLIPMLFGMVFVGFGGAVHFTLDKHYVAKIGGEIITQQEAEAAYRQYVERLKAQNPGMADAEIRKQQPMQTTLERLINDKALQVAAENLDVIAGPELVASLIAMDPIFRDEDGKFSPDLYRRLLEAQNRSISEFENDMRGLIERGLVAGFAGHSLQAPPALAQALLQRDGETRSFDVLQLESKNFTVAAPDEAELKAFLDENQAGFTRPERRVISYIHLSPEQLAGEITVTEQELKDAYELQRDNFIQPENRMVKMLRLDDSKKALEIAKIAAEKGMVKAAEAKKIPAAQITTLDKVLPNMLPTSLDDFIFTAKEGDVSGAITTPLGSYVAELTKLQPERSKTLDEVRAELSAELRAEKMADAIERASRAIDDAAAAGTKLSEIAKQHGGNIITIGPITPSGMQDNKQDIANFNELEPMINAVFNLDNTDNLSPLLESAKGDGFYIGKADKIMPAHVPPLPEIRDQLTKQFIGLERNKKAKKAAEEIAARVNKGEKLADIAAEMKLQLRRVDGLKRDGSNRNGIPIEAYNTLFDTQRLGTIAHGNSPDLQDQLGKLFGRVKFTLPPEGQMLVQLASITAAKDDANALANAQTNLNNQMANDVLLQLVAAIRERVGVSRNDPVIDQLLAYDAPPAETDSGQSAE